MSETEVKVRDFDECKDAFINCMDAAKTLGMEFEHMYPLTLFVLYKSKKRGFYVGHVLNYIFNQLLRGDVRWYLEALGIPTADYSGDPISGDELLNEIAEYIKTCHFDDAEEFYELCFPATKFAHYVELVIQYYNTPLDERPIAV